MVINPRMAQRCGTRALDHWNRFSVDLSEGVDTGSLYCRKCVHCSVFRLPSSGNKRGTAHDVWLHSYWSTRCWGVVPFRLKSSSRCSHLLPRRIGMYDLGVSFFAAPPPHPFAHIDPRSNRYVRLFVFTSMVDLDAHIKEMKEGRQQTPFSN